jgi:(R)-2-hydroxyacyl-CoA dehydratese activating ATPase
LPPTARRTKTFAVGLDLGSATTKAVVVDEAGHIVAGALEATGGAALVRGESVLEEVLAKAGCANADEVPLVTTGYGRHLLKRSHTALPEIICHAAGAFSLDRRTRTVVDIGGQDSKITAVTPEGEVGDFAMNDKCAAGTGRFLELMAQMLQLSVQDIGVVSLESEHPCNIDSTCAVFAETEIVNLRSRGAPVADLVAGVHKALSRRIAILGSTVKFRERVTFTGGVANNTGVRAALEREIGCEIWVPECPQFVGALGAALFALRGLARDA